MAGVRYQSVNPPRCRSYRVSGTTRQLGEAGWGRRRAQARSAAGSHPREVFEGRSGNQKRTDDVDPHIRHCDLRAGQIDDRRRRRVAPFSHGVFVHGTARRRSATRRASYHENEAASPPIGCGLRIHNIELKLIEVQIGSYAGEGDVVRIEDIYQRVTASKGDGPRSPTRPYVTCRPTVLAGGKGRSMRSRGIAFGNLNWHLLVEWNRMRAWL
ncbi:hypothetical protein [Consotaella aegiceratis]|uniref:hypothetical protein n=1 Tax=Consotaella aegiceratis TaxID=3097961 RepID=UPI003D803408